MRSDKSISTAYVLAFFLGGLGAHLFYIGKYKRGILYLLFCWTYIPIFLGWFDMLSIRKWLNEQKLLPVIDFDKGKYNKNIRAEKVKEKEVEVEAFNYIVSGEKFYDEKKVILPKYSHLRTPQVIINEIDEITRPRKTTVDTKYGEISFTVTMSTSGTEFIKDSLKYANVEGKPCSSEPLMEYWTTFDKLNKKQKEWYFYWRHQALKGNYLDTDLSYIILFVYELLNYSFNESAAFNASMMVKLHENYSERVPKLGNYLPNWLADFLYELGENDLAKEWDNRNYEGNYGGIYVQLVQRANELEKISFTLWKPYIRNYRETEFFQKNKNKVYKVFKESTPLLQHAYETQSTRLIDEWFKLIEGKQNRYLFASAVMGRKSSREYFVETKEYRPTEKMFDDITNLFRLSENVTRLLNGEKRQIKVDEEKLPEGLKDEMMNRFSNKKGEDVKSRFKKVQDRQNEESGSKIPKPEGAMIEPQEVPATFTLDLERIEELKQESNELQTVFEERFEEEDVPEVENVVVQDQKHEPSVVEPIAIEPEKTQPQISPFDLFSTNGAIDDTSFINSLGDIEKEFLLGFQEGRRLVLDAQQFIKSKGAMPGTFIDTLNEKAMEFLEENMLERDGEEYEIFEDFIYIIEKLKEAA